MDTQGDRIVQFIDYIANALAHYSIPHYFIPPNNMVSHRSKREIDETRKEVIQVKEKIVASVFLACLKLQVFEQKLNVLLIFTFYYKYLKYKTIFTVVPAKSDSDIIFV